MSFDALPDGWTVWSDERGGRSVLAYRPDVFDTEAFPAACLPTIFVTNTSQRSRPEARYRTTDTWHVTLYLEPEIDAVSEEYESRDAALAGAVELARRFADGEIPYRDAYQLPREEYLDRLDELTGRDA